MLTTCHIFPAIPHVTVGKKQHIMHMPKKGGSPEMRSNASISLSLAKICNKSSTFFGGGVNLQSTSGSHVITLSGKVWQKLQQQHTSENPHMYLHLFLKKALKKKGKKMMYELHYRGL